MPDPKLLPVLALGLLIGLLRAVPHVWRWLGRRRESRWSRLYDETQVDYMRQLGDAEREGSSTADYAGRWQS